MADKERETFKLPLLSRAQAIDDITELTPEHVGSEGNVTVAGAVISTMQLVGILFLGTISNV